MKKIFNVKNDCHDMFPVEIIDTIFESRGIFDKEHFLNPAEDDMLPLGDLERIDEATKIVVDGILNGKKFMVYADVDADGITSGAIGIRYLKDMGADKILAVSFRIDDYEPKEDIFAILLRAVDIFSLKDVRKAQKEADLAIEIDCQGTSLLEITDADEVIQTGYNTIMNNREKILNLLNK